MKAWELIKHLEEGGTISHKLWKGVKFTQLYNETMPFDPCQHPICVPEAWEIDKPKKKIKLYRYTLGDSKNNYYQTQWQTDIWEYNHDDYALLKAEEKVIEIDE